MSSGGGKIAGPALIIVGLLMLLGQMGMPAFGVLWPLILLAIGVGMILRYRQGGEDSGLVFSGSLLIMLTVIFLAAQGDAIDLGRHWPAFPAAVGIAFLIMARIDDKRRDAMVPGWICLGAALVLYFFSLGYFVKLLGLVFSLLGTLLKVIIPLGLIGFGGWMLFHERQESAARDSSDIPEKVSPQPPTPEGAEEAAGPAAGVEDASFDESEAEDLEAEHEAPGAGLASAEKEVPPAPIEDADYEDEEPGEEPDDEPVGEPDDEPVEEPDEVDERRRGEEPTEDDEEDRDSRF